MLKIVLFPLLAICVCIGTACQWVAFELISSPVDRERRKGNAALHWQNAALDSERQMKTMRYEHERQKASLERYYQARIKKLEREISRLRSS